MNELLNSTAAVQKRILDNKKNHGFNITDMPLEFCLTFGELTEAFDAWRKRKNSFGEELADVAIYLFGIAEINGINLGSEIDRKMEINEKRTYKKDENGVSIRQD